MKKKLYILLLLFPFWGLGGLSCDNDDDSGCVGVDCLPPATTTGEGTFGCLVNGEPFVDNSGNFNCFYQLVNGEYYFGIQAEKNLNNIDLVGLGSNQKEITLNNTIILNKDESNNFYGGISLTNLGGAIRTLDNSGQITFTEFNTNSNIVSAIFEFNIIIPETGEIIEITEGRFDAQFTQ
jgi:hypothetical protein